jgi:hypothetical protein
MKTKLHPTSLYWASFNHLEMRIPGQAVIDCAQSGSNDEAVSYWAPIVKQQCEKDRFHNMPTPESVRAELKEYGAWDEEELSDDAANWERLVWCACWNIAEEEKPDRSKPCKPVAA